MTARLTTCSVCIRRKRGGFALAGTVLALILIGVLAAGALFAAGQEAKGTRAAMLHAQLLAHAEYGSVAALSDLVSAGASEMRIGETRSSGELNEGPARIARYVTRLDSTLYLIVADARERTSLRSTGRRVALLAHIRSDSTGAFSVQRTGVHAWSEMF